MQRPNRPAVCTHLASYVLKREDVVRLLAVHTKCNDARSPMSRMAPLKISKSFRRSRPTIAQRQASNWRPTLTHDPEFESQIMLQGEPINLTCRALIFVAFAFCLLLPMSAPLSVQSQSHPGPQRGLRRPFWATKGSRGTHPRPPSSYELTRPPNPSRRLPFRRQPPRDGPFASVPCLPS
jgi:hypothetical protein